MKKAILIITLGLIGHITNAQIEKEKISATNVPANVKSTFSSIYPDKKPDKWKKEDNNYEAGFMKDGKKACMVIDSKGSWVETRAEIDPSSLPSSANNYIKEHYNGKQVTEAWKITNASDAKVTYKTEVKSDCLYFDENGQFIQTKKKK
jgi:hypothetical protein